MSIPILYATPTFTGMEELNVQLTSYGQTKGEKERERERERESITLDINDFHVGDRKVVNLEIQTQI